MRRPQQLLSIICALVCALGPAPDGADAQTVRYVDQNAPGPVHDGASWCTAFPDLQPVLIAAVAGTELRVANGRYKPSTGTGTRIATFHLKSGVALYGGFAGCGAPDPDARDMADYETVLSGDLMNNDGPNFTGRAENVFNVVRGEGADETALLDGFTISGGNANGGNPSDRGGGIQNYSVLSKAVFRNLIIRDNEAAATRGGGGIYNDHTRCQFINCVVVGNRAVPGTSQGNGGGVLNNGSTYLDGIGSEPTFRNCTIVGNHARVGGGIYNDPGARPLIENSILWGNTHNGFAGVGAQVNSLATSTMRYSDVQNLTPQFFPDPTNIALDPLMVDADGADDIFGTADDDLRLAAASPCINFGDPAISPEPTEVDVAGEPRLNGCRVDLGAHESGVSQFPADFDGDEVVDLRDAAFFQLCFGAPTSNPAWAETCLCVFDAQNDGTIDLSDLTSFQQLLTGP